MVPLTELWLAIIISAALVFVASSVIHMLLKYHQSEYRKLPYEAKLLEAMRTVGVPRGTYSFPRAADYKDMSSPEMVEKYNRGPVGMITVMQNGPPAMGKYLTMWFIYCLVIGVFAAYLAGRTLSPGEEYLQVPTGVPRRGNSRFSWLRRRPGPGRHLDGAIVERHDQKCG